MCLKTRKAPAITMKNIGRGKIAAAYMDLPLMYYNSHHPYLRQIISDVSKQLFDNPILKVEAPSCVDVALRYSNDGYVCVHLLNLSNMPLGETRSFCDYIPPIYDIRLKITKKAKKAFLQPEGIEIPYKECDNYIEVTVPKLEIHAVVVLKN